MYQNLTSRRNVLKGIGAGLLYVAGCAPEPKERVLTPKEKALEEVYSFELPNSIRPYDIDTIVSALETSSYNNALNLSRSDVMQFVNMVQSTHQELTGKTIQEHMAAQFGNKNPIDVVLVDGPLHEGLEVRGQFLHTNEPGNRNKLYIDGTLTPTKFLSYLDHETVHAYMGQGEVRANCGTHRDISYMVSRHPELLRENNDSCPLYSLLDYHVGRVNFQMDDKGIKIDFTGSRSYLAFLHMHNSIIGGNLDDAIIALERKSPNIDTFLKGDVLSYFFHMYGFDSATRIVGNFLDITFVYILGINSNFPEEKRYLLDKKMGSLFDRFVADIAQTKAEFERERIKRFETHMGNFESNFL